LSRPRPDRCGVHLARLFRLHSRTEQRQGLIILGNEQHPRPVLDHADRVVVDQLALTTISGAADLLAQDLAGLGSCRVVGHSDDVVQCQINSTVHDLSEIPTFRSAAIVLDTDAAAAPNLDAVHRSVRDGVLSALPLAPSSIRFRVGLDDPSRRRNVINTIKAETNWVNDPRNWDINITQRDSHWIAEVGYLHHSRRFSPLRRQPWSTNAVLAAVLVRIAKITEDQRVHDPFCGTGTLLVAAAQAASAVTLTGTDIDDATLDLARANLHDRGTTAQLSHADAIPFPHPDTSLDRVLSNLPFGKQVGSHTTNTTLYPAVMKELARTLRPTGRAVLLTEDKRLLLDAVARTPGIKIIRQRTLRYSGATPTAYTISRIRRSRPK
jgi:tRNA (guanine6-N2)-methyltransferase